MQRLKWVFIGSDGLRAGWGLAIYITVFSLIGGLLAMLAAHFAGPGALQPKGELSGFALIANEAMLLAGVLGMARLMARIEKRPFLGYGLARAHALSNFSLGLAAGFLALSAVVVVLLAGGLIVFTGFATTGLQAVLSALVLLFGFILVGLGEETLFRGYIMTTLARGIGFWPGAVVSSAIFAASHLGNSGENALGIAQVFVAGMVFCGLLRVSGSLWLGIGFHATWDWAQSYFYGTADSGLLFKGHLLASHPAGGALWSGGEAGPEGSLLATPVLVVSVILTSLAYRRLRGSSV